MDDQEMINVIRSRYTKLMFYKNTHIEKINPDRRKRRMEANVKAFKVTKWVCKESGGNSKKPQREKAEKEYDTVRSRHSTREGDGTSARWRWRVACLAPCCPRKGLSYDKADRLIHHVTRQTGCRTFWEGKLGKQKVDTLVNTDKTTTSRSQLCTNTNNHGFP